MHHLISHIGLKFSLFELQGTLTYEYVRSGRPAKKYEISKTDIEDASDNDENDSVAFASSQAGVNVSADGIRLCLIKNDSHLRMKFEDKNGSTAEWFFNGIDTQKMASSVSTQTTVDPDKCAMCGHKTTVGSGMRECGTQTDVVAVQQVTFSAEAGSQTVIKTEDFAVKRGTTSPTSMPTKDCASQTDLTADGFVGITNALKRQPSSTPHANEPAHKREKSSHDFKPWPPVLYMECKRQYPTSKADTGRLIIDIEKGTVWYEDVYSKVHAQTVETKQIDIKSPSTKVTYTALPNPVNRATHSLRIERLTRAEERMEVAIFYSSAPRWKTWYGDSQVGMYYFNDPEVVVDAVVHCVDRVSGREPVHDTEMDLLLEKEPPLLLYAHKRREKER